jgi:hypothetical protein
MQYVELELYFCGLIIIATHFQASARSSHFSYVLIILFTILRVLVYCMF